MSQLSGRSADRSPVAAKFFAPVQTDSGAHASSYTIDTGSSSRGESGRGVALATNPRVTPRLRMWKYTSLPLGLHGLL